MTKRDSLIANKFNGDEEAYILYMRELGSKGGKRSKPPKDLSTRFDNNKEHARKAGKLGAAKRWGKPLDSSTQKRIISNEGVESEV